MVSDPSACGLIHVDLRADNLFGSVKDGYVAVDSQMDCRAPGIVDLGYLSSQSLAAEVNVAGSTALDSEAWKSYWLALGANLFIPALAMLTWETSNARWPGKFALALMLRWMTAATDLDLVSLVR
jgi:hypothetical protein